MSSQITPIVTWVPWNPVSMKKLAPNRLVWSVSPLCTKWVNSYDLHAHEEEPADERRAEPCQQRLAVALLRAVERQHHEQRAEQQQRGADGHQRDLDDRLEHLPGGRIGPRLVGTARPGFALVHQVVRDQRREEHALGPDEGPDRQLPAVETGRGLQGVRRDPTRQWPPCDGVRELASTLLEHQL